MTGDEKPPLQPEEVDDQVAVQVPGPEDTSLITTEPTGFLHGDEETAQRAGATED
jgi:hypothetical protein